MKKSWLKENYIACFKFFKESEKHILFATLLFFITAFIGFLFPIFFREQIIDIMTQMIGLLDGKSAFELVSLIFFNNMKASFMAMVLGIAIGIFPIFTGIVNGYILGFVSRQVVAVEGIWVMWQLLPHGIFEIPAILFSIGIGVKIGADLFKEKAKEKLRKNFREGLRFFVFVVFPLLLIAGIIEGLLIALLS